MRPEHRILLIAAVGWGAAWLLVGAAEQAGWVGALAGAGAVVALVTGSRMPRLTTAVVVVSLALAAIALIGASVAMTAPRRSPPELTDAAATARDVTVTATISSPAVPARSGFGGARVRMDADVGRSPVVLFAPAADAAPIGATVRISGSVRATGAGEQHAFLIFVDDSRVLAPPPWWAAWAEPLRAGFRGAASELPGDGGALLPGLAIGDTAAVPATLDDAMIAASLSHLTAVSGANCAVVVAAIVALGAAVGLTRGIRLTLAGAALGAFVVLVTPQPSVLRAAVMAAIVLVVLGGGRRVRGTAALALAVIVLLAADPWLARSFGFALSALAAAGLLLWTRPLAGALARWMPRPLAVAVAVPLAAQVACQPVLVLLDPVLPLGGVIANLLAEPAAPLATVLGLLACLALPVWPAAGELLCRLAWLPAAWIAQVARTVAELPLGRLPWLGGLAGVLVSAAAITGVWVLARHRRARSAGLVIMALTAVVYVGGLAGVSALRVITMPGDWMFAACDIGQGDAVLVRDGPHVALVDVGPDPEPLRVCLQSLGIDRIELLVLTHYDHDHVGGVDAVVGRVDHALVGLPDDAAAARIPAKLAAGGAEVRRGVAGQSGALGGVRWRVLWPEADAATMRTGNPASVTTTFDGRGIRSIFLGDLGEQAQEALLATGAVAPVDVVKVAHHGSADQSEALYERLHAAVGLISVGRDNGYGHPTPRLLGILARTGTAAERTDLQGLVLVAPTPDGRLRVWSERAPAPAVGGPG